MDLKFSEMSVDTSLAQEYLKKNEGLLELYNDYNGITEKYKPYYYDGKEFQKNFEYNHERTSQDRQIILQNLRSSLKLNATLIMQLEYHFRNIPIEVTNAQINLLIQNLITCHSSAATEKLHSDLRTDCVPFLTSDPLLVLGSLMNVFWKEYRCLEIDSKATAAICHLFVTLIREAGFGQINLKFRHDPIKKEFEKRPVKGLDSGTVAVISEDADVDSAVDKFLSISIQAPWRLRRILVQESVYQQFKDALSWKCNLNKSGNKSTACSVLCSATLTYNDRTFLIDPVELSAERPSVVTVEAFRTTKEMISLVQQDQTRYLSLWTNGIAEINEVTHSTKSPVVWVNNVADFRGPPQISEAVFAYVNDEQLLIKKCYKVAKMCELSQAWLKLDLESRRDILYGVLDKLVSLDPANKVYADTRNSLSVCTLKSFVDVGKDYVCVGMSQPKGFITPRCGILSCEEIFKLLLLGNALIVYWSFFGTQNEQEKKVYASLEEAGVPVVYEGDWRKDGGDFEVLDWHPCSLSTRNRVIWTNSGTIFAN